MIRLPYAEESMICETSSILHHDRETDGRMDGRTIFLYQCCVLVLDKKDNSFFVTVLRVFVFLSTLQMILPHLRRWT